jgi:zinc transporter ZupT
MRTSAASLIAPILPALPPAWFLHQNYSNRTAISGFVVICGLFYFLHCAVGIPAYFLARSYRRHAWFDLLLGFFGMTLLYVAVNVLFPTIKANISKALIMTPYFGALGAVMGLMFWFVSRPDRREERAVETSNKTQEIQRN